MRKIPKQFDIMGHTIKVCVINARDWETLSASYPALVDTVGLYSGEVQLIIIKKAPQSIMLHTLYHEIMHAALHIMGHRLWENEKFVDQLGGILAQIETSAVEGGR